MATYRLDSSNELMQNYFQADVLLPEEKFEAQQTDAGTALLFSIGSSGVFYLTKEVPGIAHGWTRDDLSTAQIQRDLPAGSQCTQFASALTVVVPGRPSAIHLAMVINDGSNDHLYLSLANSAADTRWSAAPVWTACPFNASPAPASLHIAGVQISEASDGEYIVVDIVRNPGDPTALLARYYIDVSQPAAPRWVAHSTAIDLEASHYASCLGRASDAFGVDGFYLAGTVSGIAQLVYAPLYNPFDPGAPPLPRRLHLSGQLVPDTIAACRNTDNSSDLYATANGALYYFSANNQHDGAKAIQVASSPLLNGIRDLFVSAAEGRVTVWGLNGNDQVVYLSADPSQAAQAPAWSTPMVILSGTDAVSPYLDRAYSANTFFAHSAGGLVKAVKSPGTSLWTSHSIILPPLNAQTNATRVASYTSQVQVTGPDGMPAKNVTLSLTASNVTSVYVNHLYYVVGPKPIQVSTDEVGSLTIVESIKTLSGTRLTLSIGDQSLTINPMGKPVSKLAQLSSVQSLRSATITADDGSTRPLVAASVSDDDLKNVAQSNSDLQSAYASLAASPSTFLAVRAAPPQALSLFPDAILTDLGDLFSWLESGIESVVSIVEDTATGVWHFVAHIAGEVYHGVLDVVEKVVAAFQWVFNAIKVAIEILILFLEFLFEWRDILVTHRVMKNVFTRYVQHAIDSLSQDKESIASAFSQLQGEINRWAGIADFGPSAGSVTGDDTYGARHSAPANLGLHHYKGNAGDAVTAYAPPAPAEAIFQDLLNLLQQEGETLSGAYDAIQTDIVGQFGSLSAADILKRFAAIVADTLLQSTEAIVLATIDVLAQLATGFMDMLQATIDIPVLSWLYRVITGDDLSVLDLICLVGAIPATILHKAAAGSVPFPRGDSFTDALLDANSFAEVQAAFMTVTSGAQPRAMRTTAAAGDPVLNDSRLKVFGFVTGLFAFAGSVVLIATTAIQRILDAVGFDNARPKTLATLACIGNIAYVSPNIATFINAKTDNWYQQMNNTLTGISILKGFAAIPFSSSGSAVVKYGFPAVESLINLVWNVPVIMNIVDNRNRWNTDYKSLIPESIGNFAFNCGGILELPITLTRDPEGKAGEILTQYGLMLTYGVCMPIAGGIYEFEAGQNHS